MKVEILNLLPEFGTNTYITWDENSKEAIIIDPSAPSSQIIDRVKELGLTPKFLINTHGHGDHIGGNGLVKSSFDVRFIIHQNDSQMLVDSAKNLSLYWDQNVISPKADIEITKDYSIKLGDKDVQLIPTPGHSRGGICILVDGLLFSGDTLFAESIGRTDLPGGDLATLTNSIKEKLFELPEETVVYPGHGPKTTIGDEIVGNPFVGLAARL